MKKLYHGTIFDFDVIDPSQGKGYKDFGKGFYTTAVPSHADRVALKKKKSQQIKQEVLRERKKIKNLNPVVAYRYNLIFDEDISDLSVKIFEEADIEWLKFIMMNRKCSEKTHKFDIVIGPTADADTIKIINDYYGELEKTGYPDALCKIVLAELEPKNLPRQYYFGSNKAVDHLRFDYPKRQVIA